MSRVIHVVEFFNEEENEWMLDECYYDYQNAVEVAEVLWGERNIEYRVTSFKSLPKLAGELVDYGNVNREIEPLSKPEYSTSFRCDSGWKSNSQNPYAYVSQDD